MFTSSLRQIGLGALGGLALAAFIVWPIAHGAGSREMERAAKARIEAAERVITRAVAERDQARAEVDKTNRAIAEQVADLARVMSSDKVAREAAARRMEKATQEAAAEAKKAGERALAAREVIQNVADQCARAGVPADVVRVLNDILAPANNSG